MTNNNINETKTNILLVEDSDIDASVDKRILSLHMSHPCHVRHAKSMAEAESFLKENSKDIDLILLDLGLPDTKSGKDTYQRIEKVKGDIPVIILSSVQDHPMAVEIVKTGAQDYVRKSSIIKDPDILCQAIDFAICRYRNMESYKTRKEQELKEKDNVIGWVTGSYSVEK